MPPLPSGPMARLTSSELKYLAMLAGARICTTGRVYWVKAADDADYPEFSKLVPKGRLFNDINLALAACRDFTNDYVMVCQQDAATGWALTAALTLAKDTTHLIGVGSKVTITGTAASVLSGVVNAPSRCEIANLHLEGIGASNTYAVTLGAGYGNLVRDCRLFSTAAGAAALADVKVDGEATEIRRCRLGSRAAHNAASNIDVGSGGHNLEVHDCGFYHFAGAVGDEFINMHASAVAPHIIDNCIGVNQNLGATVMTAAVTTTLANGVLLRNCAWVGAGYGAATGKGWVVPGATGNAVTSANSYDPGLGIDSAFTAAADT